MRSGSLLQSPEEVYSADTKVWLTPIDLVLDTRHRWYDVIKGRPPNCLVVSIIFIVRSRYKGFSNEMGAKKGKSTSIRPTVVTKELRHVPGCWQVLSPTRKETSSEACQGRARFQQHQDASCHQVFFLQGKLPKEIHVILTETLACFLPGRAKDLSAPLSSESHLL